MSKCHCISNKLEEFLSCFAFLPYILKVAHIVHGAWVLLSKKYILFPGCPVYRKLKRRLAIHEKLNLQQIHSVRLKGKN